LHGAGEVNAHGETIVPFGSHSGPVLGHEKVTHGTTEKPLYMKSRPTLLGRATHKHTPAGETVIPFEPTKGVPATTAKGVEKVVVKESAKAKDDPLLKGDSVKPKEQKVQASAKKPDGPLQGTMMARFFGKPEPKGQGGPNGVNSLSAANAAAKERGSAYGQMVMTPYGPMLLPGSDGLSMPSAVGNAFTEVTAAQQEKYANAFPQNPNMAMRFGYGMPMGNPMMSYPPMMAYRNYSHPPMAYGAPAQMGYPQMAHPQMAPAHAAAYAMPRTGTATVSDSVPTAGLISTLRESMLPSEREMAADTLAQVDWKSEPHVVKTLVDVAGKDPAPVVRASCVRALGKMKANTLPVVQAVQALKSDSDARVRQEVEQALSILGQ
jgi:hypothetical protein